MTNKNHRNKMSTLGDDGYIPGWTTAQTAHWMIDGDANGGYCGYSHSAPTTQPGRALCQWGLSYHHQWRDWNANRWFMCGTTTNPPPCATDGSCLAAPPPPSGAPSPPSGAPSPPAAPDWRESRGFAWDVTLKTSGTGVGSVPLFEVMESEKDCKERCVAHQATADHPNQRTCIGITRLVADKENRGSCWGWGAGGPSARPDAKYISYALVRGSPVCPGGWEEISQDPVKHFSPASLSSGRLMRIPGAWDHQLGENAADRYCWRHW